MFFKRDDSGWKEPMEGVRLRVLSHGKSTMMVEFHLTEGARIPEHGHPHEQIGYLISGRIVLVIDGRPHSAEPGDSWCIAGDVPHSGQALEDTVVIEAFSPAREDLLP